jgi:quaternary ammonium compound-resistance protein SugE
MSWLLLFVAGLFEVAWAVGLEYSEGFSRPLPTLGTGVAMVVSLFLLARAVRDLPIGTAYAVWTGIGAVGTALVGIAVFDEPATLARLGFISVIVFGIVGLHAVSGSA